VVVHVDESRGEHESGRIDDGRNVHAGVQAPRVNVSDMLGRSNRPPRVARFMGLMKKTPNPAT
jgi:hypothetical protein